MYKDILKSLKKTENETPEAMHSRHGGIVNNEASNSSQLQDVLENSANESHMYEAIAHPRASALNHTTALKNGSLDIKAETAAMTPHKEVIEEAIKNPLLHKNLTNNENLNTEHISSLINYPDTKFSSIEKLQYHKNLSTNNISEILNHPKHSLYVSPETILKHPNANPSHVDQFLNISKNKIDKEGYGGHSIGRIFSGQSHPITDEHIKNVINNFDPKFWHQALVNENIKPETIDEALMLSHGTDNYSNIARAVSGNKNLEKESMEHILNESVGPLNPMIGYNDNFEETHASSLLRNKNPKDYSKFRIISAFLNKKSSKKEPLSPSFRNELIENLINTKDPESEHLDAIKEFGSHKPTKEEISSISNNPKHLFRALLSGINSKEGFDNLDKNHVQKALKETGELGFDNGDHLINFAKHASKEKKNELEEMLLSHRPKEDRSGYIAHSLDRVDTNKQDIDKYLGYANNSTEIGRVLGHEKFEALPEEDRHQIINSSIKNTANEINSRDDVNRTNDYSRIDSLMDYYPKDKLNSLYHNFNLNTLNSIIRRRDISELPEDLAHSLIDKHIGSENKKSVADLIQNLSDNTSKDYMSKKILETNSPEIFNSIYENLNSIYENLVRKDHDFSTEDVKKIFSTNFEQYENDDNETFKSNLQELAVKIPEKDALEHSISGKPNSVELLNHLAQNSTNSDIHSHILDSAEKLYNMGDREGVYRNISNNENLSKDNLLRLLDTGARSRQKHSAVTINKNLNSDDLMGIYDDPKHEGWEHGVLGNPNLNEKHASKMFNQMLNNNISDEVQEQDHPSVEKWTEAPTNFSNGVRDFISNRNLSSNIIHDIIGNYSENWDHNYSGNDNNITAEREGLISNPNSLIKLIKHKDFGPEHMNKIIRNDDFMQDEDIKEAVKGASAYAVPDDYNDMVDSITSLSDKEYNPTSVNVHPDLDQIKMIKHLLHTEPGFEQRINKTNVKKKLGPQLADKFPQIYDAKGNTSREKIENIEKQLEDNGTKYNVSFGEWEADSSQMHDSETTQVVFRLNLTNDLIKKLKEAGVYDTFKEIHSSSKRSSHPMDEHSLGWARIDDSSPGHIHVDEIQNDFEGDLRKSLDNEKRRFVEEHGENRAEEAQKAIEEFVKQHEEKYNKISKILSSGHESINHAIQSSVFQYYRKNHPDVHNISFDTPEDQANQSGLTSSTSLPVHFRNTYINRPKALKFETKPKTEAFPGWHDEKDTVQLAKLYKKECFKKRDGYANLLKTQLQMKFPGFPKVGTRPDQEISQVGTSDQAKMFSKIAAQRSSRGGEFKDRTIKENEKKLYNVAGSMAAHYRGREKGLIGGGSRGVVATPIVGKKVINKPTGMVTPDADEAIRHHEAMHYAISDLAYKYNMDSDHITNMANKMTSHLHPDDKKAIHTTLANLGYDPKSEKFHEETLAFTRDLLHDPDKRRMANVDYIHMDKNIPNKLDLQRLKKSWRQIVDFAKKLTPNNFHAMIKSGGSDEQ